MPVNVLWIKLKKYIRIVLKNKGKEYGCIS